MKKKFIKKLLGSFSLILIFSFALSSCTNNQLNESLESEIIKLESISSNFENSISDLRSSNEKIEEILKKNEKIKIKVLILPKFEIGEMTGDEVGEAQLYFEEYLKGSDEYDIVGGIQGNKLYVKDGVALYIAGIGKTNVTMTVSSILLDDRFDFSDCYFISTGCAGSAIEYGVMGDVFIITSTIDYDLGHTADSSDLTNDKGTTWFHDDEYDSSSIKILNQDLCNKIYDLVKDVEIKTTEKTKNYMAKAFNDATWATRDPKVLKGTTVSSDNYWKGQYGHNNANLMAETYKCPDPYATTEMEDSAIALTLDRMGYLDKLIIIRDSVNTDVFMNGATPESLWDKNTMADRVDLSDSEEVADIFDIAMENNFKVGKVIIDAILDGSLQ